MEVADRSCYPDGHQGLGSGEAGHWRASLCVITRLDSRAISNKKVEIANFQDCSPLNKKVPLFRSPIFKKVVKIKGSCCENRRFGEDIRRSVWVTCLILIENIGNAIRCRTENVVRVLPDFVESGDFEVHARDTWNDEPQTVVLRFNSARICRHIQVLIDRWHFVQPQNSRLGWKYGVNWGSVPMGIYPERPSVRLRLGMRPVFGLFCGKCWAVRVPECPLQAPPLTP